MVKPESGRVKKERPQGAPQPAHSTLFQLLRRLDLRPKFARTCDLVKRFFESVEGLELLKAWRTAITGRVDADVDDARSNQAWVIFYAAWRFAVNENSADYGDARETVIWLFDENIFKSEEESLMSTLQYQVPDRDGDISLVMPATTEDIKDGPKKETWNSRVCLSVEDQTLEFKEKTRPF